MHKHNFEEDDTGYISGYTCTKCKMFTIWALYLTEDCPIADEVAKEKYVDNTDYSKIDEKDIKRMLGHGLTHFIKDYER